MKRLAAIIVALVFALSCGTVYAEKKEGKGPSEKAFEKANENAAFKRSELPGKEKGMEEKEKAKKEAEKAKEEAEKAKEAAKKKAEEARKKAEKEAKAKEKAAKKAEKEKNKMMDDKSGEKGKKEEKGKWWKNWGKKKAE